MRDRSFDDAAESLGPGFAQQKLLVKSGTVAVLHFGLFHRAARRMPDSIFRNMFKLQFFRSSAPTEASWDHQPDADGGSPPFADTGEPRVKQVVWETVWDWMRGAPRSAESAYVDSDSEASTLVDTLTSSQDEVERIGSGYSLGTLVRGGGAEGETALRELLRLSRHGSEDAMRASMYALASGGSTAAPAIAAALSEAVATDDDGGSTPQASATRQLEYQPSREVTSASQRRASITSLAYALGEAVRSAESAEGPLAALSGCMEAMGSEVVSAADADDEAAAIELHTVIASIIQAVGCIGERVVTTAAPAEAAKLTAQIAEMLLPWTTASSHEPSDDLKPAFREGFVKNGADFTKNGNPAFADRFDKLHGGQAREGAAYGLLRLASGGLRERDGPRTVGQVVDHPTPAHHSDERYIPALCDAALRRLRSGHDDSRRDVLEPLFEGAEKLWQDRAAEAAVNSPEPWLADDEAAQHVRWLDSD